MWGRLTEGLNRPNSVSIPLLHVPAQSFRCHGAVFSSGYNLEIGLVLIAIGNTCPFSSYSRDFGNEYQMDESGRGARGRELRAEQGDRREEI